MRLHERLQRLEKTSPWRRQITLPAPNDPQLIASDSIAQALDAQSARIREDAVHIYAQEMNEHGDEMCALERMFAPALLRAMRDVAMKLRRRLHELRMEFIQCHAC